MEVVQPDVTVLPGKNSPMDDVQIRLLDYSDPGDAAAMLELLNEYACSEMGGGQTLTADVQRALPARLAAMPHALSGLAVRADRALGLVNCFETLSSFKARPILNIHDIAVTADCQGQGVGTALLRWVESQAIARGCCKLTLEVLEGNATACAVYRRFGFAAYGLDPRFGQAMFWEKELSD